jgi:hypothetical protein
MKTFQSFLVVLALLLVSVRPGLASQNTTTQTTLSAAVSDTKTTLLTVASATGISASTTSTQRFILVDKELMQVRAISSTTLTVIRGANGTIVTPHVSGAVVTYGAIGKWDPVTGYAYGVFFNGPKPSGTCTTASNEYEPLVHLPTGDSFSCFGGTWGETAGPEQPVKEVSFHGQAATAMVDQSFFVADRRYQVVGVRFAHAVAETTAATLRVQVTKDSSTNAPGAGTDLLTNTSGAGFDCKATANTVQTGALSTTLSDLKLAAGDRLAVDFTASATELVGVTITVSLRPL